ncbi:MAG: cupredoxin family copper-binding protein [Acetobacteraceae bacterium]|nr:cupredoxin family copper-binding protein [Acetobacteraceae bacterium]
MSSVDEPGTLARRGLLSATGVALIALVMPRARAEDRAVTIDNFVFTPPTLTVPKGTKVTWTNRDDIPHVVVCPGAKARSSALDTGDSYSLTFAQAGTFDYYCGMHPTMKGSVVVSG